MVKEDVSELAELMREQVRATNRVNHAVRAIVIPSTIVLIAFLISVPFFAFGIFLSEAALLFLAGIILVTGGVIAIMSQIMESALSDMPAQASISGTEASEDVGEATQGGAPVLEDDPSLKDCNSCGAKYPRARMACPDCGMN